MAQVSNYVRFHGIDLDVRTPLPYRHLMLWQRFREEPFCHANFLNGDPAEHFLEACRLLFTPQQLIIHPWFERMAYAYTHYTGIILIGAGSSGKSHFMGIVALLDYLADFGNVYITLVSTDKGGLLKRSMASAIEYLGYLKNKSSGWVIPAKYIAQSTSIVPEDSEETNVESIKPVIRGVAIHQGTEMDAKGSLIGVHLPRVRSIADEIENMGDRADFFLAAQSNAILGCSDYKLMVAFNSQSMQGPGTRMATPVGGWPSVNLDTEEWVTAKGYKVLRFDGHRSPGLKDPKKYHFLPTAASIAKVKEDNNGNEDSPGYWAFVRAFPPSDLGSRTVLTESMLTTWRMRDPVVWDTPPFWVAALDPAFTADGNECILGRAAVGMTNEGKYTICYDPQTYAVPLSASSGIPILQQIGDAVEAKLAEWGIPMFYFGCDDSGTQSVADYMTIRKGPGIYRTNFAAKPPDIPLVAGDGTTSVQRYKDTVTWLYYTVNEYAQYGQIRGLPAKAAAEFCKRRLDDKLKGILKLETKKVYKARMKDGESPDTADMCAIIAGLVRDRLGLVPGAKSWMPAIPQSGGGIYIPSFVSGVIDRVKELNNIDLLTRNRYGGP